MRRIRARAPHLPPPRRIRNRDRIREVAAAHDTDRQHWVLVDALERTQAGELDARIVEDGIEGPDEARALAADYLLHAAGAGRPLVS